MRRTLIGLFASFTVVTQSFALQFNIAGHDRMEVNIINNIDAVSGGVSSSGYWTHRLYLKPSLLIDDHFSIYTEWKILNYNQTSGAAPNVGTKFGSNDGTAADVGSPSQNSFTASNHNFAVTRAWIEWTSDWGLMRGGRAPRHWGLGMVYHSGDGDEFDYQYTEDLVQYLLPLGFITFSVGFGKIFEGAVETDADDSEDYFVHIHYDNPEIELDSGFLYNRAIRATATENNDYHLIDVYGIKTWGSLNLSLGGEFGFVFGDNGNGNKHNGLAVIGKGSWRYSRFLTRLFFAYITGDSTPGDVNRKNFPYVSHNIRPALIMFREDVGGLNTGSFNTIRAGYSLGNFENGRGVILFNVGEDYTIMNGLVVGLDFIYGMTAAKASSGSRNLGMEIDFRGSYQWYENFETVFQFGYLLTGNAYGSTGDVWSIQSKGVLTF